ncbi:hypothetical protein D9757_011872 [Collybiopsis confluens]|uniref:Uncharacterized protein n=1 Tax=Collybiopsis confluens TaxID=2823264 RepID=A0A8H5LRE1_9AGAR|nr:hypothetical protein D9757_011872 [Collybiopsis confluens]
MHYPVSCSEIKTIRAMDSGTGYSTRWRLLRLWSRCTECCRLIFNHALSLCVLLVPSPSVPMYDYDLEEAVSATQLHTLGGYLSAPTASSCLNNLFISLRALTPSSPTRARRIPDDHNAPSLRQPHAPSLSPSPPLSRSLSLSTFAVVGAFIMQFRRAGRRGVHSGIQSPGLFSTSAMAFSIFLHGTSPH